MTETPGGRSPRQKRRRWLRLAIIGLAVFMAIFIVSVEITSSSKFCSTCHYMKPFYQSWQASRHSKVECKVCHYPPGLRSTLKAKMEGLVMVGRYWTQLYRKSKPWAEIQDQSCLQRGCHDKRLLEGRVTFKTITFDHKAHFEDLKRGKRLRCTSCHSQIVQGQHITVTENSCFICHFKESSSHPRAAACVLCHRKDNLLRTTSRFDHATVFEKGFSCDKCHSQVIVGDGAVPRENCYRCHFERERLEKYGDTELVHTTHITANKIECDQCHLRIQHKIVRDIETVADCRTCHTGSHEAQKILFLGEGGKGVGHAVPNVMFEKGLSCKGCHIFHEASGGALLKAETLRSAAPACESCHGRGFARILKNWETATARRLAEVRGIYSRAVVEVNKAPAARKTAARVSLVEAAFDIDVVERGKSVHNMTYSQELLSAALAKVRDALDAVGSAWKPDLASALTRETPNACLTCHAGIEEIRSPVFGLTFPHGRHLIKQKMECAACHSNRTRHGELVATKTSCAPCHHQDPKKDCGSCHTIQKTLYRGGPLGDLKVPKDVMAEADTECAACHIDKTKKLIRPDAGACVACHNDEAYRKTFENWREAFGRRVMDLKAALHEIYKKPIPEAEKARIRAVEETLAALELDGSGGVHNFAFAEAFLTKTLKTIKSGGEEEGKK